MPRLVLATANLDKTREIEPLLWKAAVELVAITDLVPGWAVAEIGATIEENARLKARAAAAATGLPSVADDTGLFVEALGGAPGARASRYAGEDATYGDNVAKLLEALGGVPPAGRRARFRTAVVLVRPDGVERAFEGVLEGRIAEAPHGEEGFGYDPVFVPEREDRTVAEMQLAEKNRLSHRARAFQAVARFLVRHPRWLEANSRP